MRRPVRLECDLIQHVVFIGRLELRDANKPVVLEVECFCAAVVVIVGLGILQPGAEFCLLLWVPPLHPKERRAVDTVGEIVPLFVRSFAQVFGRARLAELQLRGEVQAADLVSLGYGGVVQDGYAAHRDCGQRDRGGLGDQYLDCLTFSHHPDFTLPDGRRQIHQSVTAIQQRMEQKSDFSRDAGPEGMKTGVGPPCRNLAQATILCRPVSFDFSDRGLFSRGSYDRTVHPGS